jgi:hypothetical protein
MEAMDGTAKHALEAEPADWVVMFEISWGNIRAAGD